MDNVVLVLLLILVGFFISIRPRWTYRNDLYHTVVPVSKGHFGGKALKYFYVKHQKKPNNYVDN